MPDFAIEDKLSGNVAGIDEAGRGPLCGPVVAAAVIYLKRSQGFINHIDDSKKLSRQKREELYENIINDQNIIYANAVIDNDIIDKVNIFNATKLAMQQAYEKLALKADSVLIDGKFKMITAPVALPVIKGDKLSISIATASIIAKIIRDNIMQDLHKIHPEYNWQKNQGYGTREHLEAIEKYGITKFHRISFAPIKKHANLL
jgi:ribonuclease HII